MALLRVYFDVIRRLSVVLHKKSEYFTKQQLYLVNNQNMQEQADK